MSVKAFKYYTIQAGGTPQPVIGTYLTAAVTQSQLNAANTQSGLILGQLTLAVADSSMFAGAAYADIIDPSTYATERVRVLSNATSTTLIVQGAQKTHPGGAYGTGAWVALGDFAQSLFIQGVAGNAGTLYIGSEAQMVKATGVGVIMTLVTVAGGNNPYTFSTSRQGLANAETLSQYWIDGTTSDSYLPSIGQV